MRDKDMNNAIRHALGRSVAESDAQPETAQTGPDQASRDGAEKTAHRSFNAEIRRKVGRTTRVPDPLE